MIGMDQPEMTTILQRRHNNHDPTDAVVPEGPAPVAPARTELSVEDIKRLQAAFSFSFEETLTKATAEDPLETSSRSEFDEPGYAKAVDLALERVKKQCEDALKEMEKIQTQLQSLPKRQPPPIPEPTIPFSKEESHRLNAPIRMAILREKESALRIEIAQRRGEMLHHEEKDYVLTRAEAQKEVADIIQAYRSKEGLDTLQGQLSDELDRKESEQTVKQLAHEANEELRDSLNDILGRGAGVSAGDIIRKQTDVKTRLKRDIDKYTRGLYAFMERHYPTPITNVRKRELDEDEHDTPRNPLIELIERMLVRVQNTEDQRYVTLEEGTYHPPHLEMLIKANVVERDPEDDRRIKLVEYY